MVVVRSAKCLLDQLKEVQCRVVGSSHWTTQYSHQFQIGCTVWGGNLQNLLFSEYEMIILCLFVDQVDYVGV